MALSRIFLNNRWLLDTITESNSCIDKNEMIVHESGDAYICYLLESKNLHAQILKVLPASKTAVDTFKDCPFSGRENPLYTRAGIESHAKYLKAVFTDSAHICNAMLLPCCLGSITALDDKSPDELQGGIFSIKSGCILVKINIPQLFFHQIVDIRINVAITEIIWIGGEGKYEHSGTSALDHASLDSSNELTLLYSDKELLSFFMKNKNLLYNLWKSQEQVPHSIFFTKVLKVLFSGFHSSLEDGSQIDNNAANSNTLPTSVSLLFNISDEDCRIDPVQQYILDNLPEWNLKDDDTGLSSWIDLDYETEEGGYISGEPSSSSFEPLPKSPLSLRISSIKNPTPTFQNKPRTLSPLSYQLSLDALYMDPFFSPTSTIYILNKHRLTSSPYKNVPSQANENVKNPMITHLHVQANKLVLPSFSSMVLAFQKACNFDSKK
jgi:hypothetical protein